MLTWSPLNFGERRAEYLELLIQRLIPRIAREQLAAFCDVFVEDSAYTVEEARQIFRAAAHTVSGLNSTPTSSPPEAALSSRRRYMPSRPITWSASPMAVSVRWPGQGS